MVRITCLDSETVEKKGQPAFQNVLTTSELARVLLWPTSQPRRVRGRRSSAGYSLMILTIMVVLIIMVILIVVVILIMMILVLMARRFAAIVVVVSPDKASREQRADRAQQQRKLQNRPFGSIHRVSSGNGETA